MSSKVLGPAKLKLSNRNPDADAGDWTNLRLQATLRSTLANMIAAANEEEKESKKPGDQSPVVV